MDSESSPVLVPAKATGNWDARGLDRYGWLAHSRTQIPECLARVLQCGALV